MKSNVQCVHEFGVGLLREDSLCGEGLRLAGGDCLGLRLAGEDCLGLRFAGDCLGLRLGGDCLGLRLGGGDWRGERRRGDGLRRAPALRDLKRWRVQLATVVYMYDVYM